MSDSIEISAPIAAWAQKSPDAVAIATAEGELTFSELDRALDWLAHQFIKAGVQHTDTIGLNLACRVQHLMASLALSRLGAPQVALPMSEPTSMWRQLITRLKVGASISNDPTEPQTVVPRIPFPAGSLADYKGHDVPPLPLRLMETEYSNMPFHPARPGRQSSSR